MKTFQVILLLLSLKKYSSTPDGYTTCDDNNCVRCTNNKKDCFECSDGYYVNSQRTCSMCNKTCYTCSSYFACTSCRPGYHLKNGTYCIQCDAFCVTCQSLYGICDECKSGYFGAYCGSSCDVHCVNNICDKETGMCTYGCVTGYYKDSNKCQQCSQNCTSCTDASVCTACSSGTWGSKCQLSCSTLCTSSGCDRFTGYCHECLPSYYGHVCQYSCSINCSSEGCDRENGRCIFCRTANYGNTCQLQCSNGCTVIQDINDTCERTTGECQHDCKTGYEGPTCEQTANPKTTSTSVTTSNTSKTVKSLPPNDITTSGTNTGKPLTTPTTTEDKGLQDDKTQTAFHDPPNKVSVIGGVIGGGSIIVAVAVVVVLICLRMRRKARQINGDYVEHSYQDLSLRNQDPEYKALNFIPNEVNVGVKKVKHTKKLDNPHGIYVNTAVVEEASAIPTNISSYLNEDVMEEMDEVHVDPTGGRLDGIYESYYNTCSMLRRKMSLNELAEIVAQRSDDEYNEEFKKLANGLIRDYESAMKKENRNKNRYKRVLPYDSTRVILKDGEDDYINASFIDGYKRKHAYIATTGPTVAHSENFSLFWRMVWQENVDTIVVLTKLMEEEKMKFEQYWPQNGQTEKYGQIEVQTVSEKCFADYTMRTFAVCKDNKHTIISQAHYTAWTENSVYDDVASLLEFRHRIQALHNEQTGPLLVHCCAGIGRTGTYIALDILIQEGVGEQAVDIYGCVNGLRGQRVNMVLSVDQYKYLHYAVVYALTVYTGHTSVDEMSTCLTDQEKSKLAEQYQKMTKLKINTAETMTVNKDANAMDVCYLGVGIVHRRKFLVTETPDVETVYDFMRSINRDHVSCVVSMDPKNTEYLYLPPLGQELKLGKFTISCVRGESRPNYILRELNIYNRNGKDVNERTVNHYQYIRWSAGSQVPDSPGTIIQMVRDVERIAAASRESAPILIHCRNGSERSGLLCTVSLLLEKMSREQEVSVVNTVRQVQSRRPLAIPTLAQFIFCHEVISASLSSGPYVNVDDI